MTPLNYEARIRSIKLKDASQIPHAYEILASLQKRATIHLNAEFDEWQRTTIMKNVDCVIVYVKVGNKLVPEIFDTVEEAQRYAEKVERNEA